MATGVVLHHRSQGHQMGGATCLPPGSSTAAGVMGQQRARLGAIQGRSCAAGPYSRPPREREINLVVVAHVMLIRRLLPCKCRPLRLWEFNPEGPRALQHFMGATPMGMYKLFFGSQEICPDLTEDAGLSCNRPDTQVSSPVPGHAIRTFIINLPFKELSFEQEWIAKAKLIRCPPPSLRPRQILC